MSGGGWQGAHDQREPRRGGAADRARARHRARAPGVGTVASVGIGVAPGSGEVARPPHEATPVPAPAARRYRGAAPPAPAGRAARGRLCQSTCVIIQRPFSLASSR